METSHLRNRMPITALTDPKIIVPAIGGAFAKLDPRTLIKNPVMFVVEVVAALTTIIVIRDLMAGAGDLGFSFQIILWLWFTILFANFAEAVAEGRGKAQAATLRQTREETVAKLIVDEKTGLWDTPGSVEKVNKWDANTDVWELYDLPSDFSQANDLAAEKPEKLAEMKALFLEEAKANNAFPIGAGLWLRTHPEDRIKSPYSSWTFDTSTIRMPEFSAPGLGRESSHVVIKAKLDEGASGVLYALGGFSGGLTLYMDKGELVYEYNMMEIERTSVRSKDKIAPGDHEIEVDTIIDTPGAAAEIVLTVNGQEVGRGTVKRTVPAAFTASESFDVGVDLGSPVSPDYFDRRPFRFDGMINEVEVTLR